MAGFEDILMGIEIAGEARALYERQDAFEEHVNREVVSSGMEAVLGGLVTTDTLVDLASGLIERHVLMIRKIGIVEDVVQEGKHPMYSVTSDRIPISAGTEVALRQSNSGSLDAGGFTDYKHRHGLGKALEDYATPASTSVLGFNFTTGRNTPDISIPFGSPSFSDPETDFYNQWSKSAHVLGKTSGLLPKFMRREGAPKIPVKFTPDQVIFAAGQIIRFGNLLDLVEDASGISS